MPDPTMFIKSLIILPWFAAWTALHVDYTRLQNETAIHSSVTDFTKFSTGGLHLVCTYCDLMCSNWNETSRKKPE